MEAEQAKSAQTGRALAVEKKDVARESEQDDPKVPNMGGGWLGVLVE